VPYTNQQISDQLRKAYDIRQRIDRMQHRRINEACKLAGLGSMGCQLHNSLVSLHEASEIIDRYDGDADQVARDLVDAANRAGGKDNITAVFVAGSGFLGNDSPQMAEARARHSITRAREGTVAQGEVEDAAKPGASRVRRALTSRVAFLIYGFAIGVALALAWR